MEIAFDDLVTLVKNRSMVRMLSLMGKSQGGLATRDLLEKLGANEFHAYLKDAIELGYVSRREVKKRGFVGRPALFNIVTKKGMQIVEIADKLGILEP